MAINQQKITRRVNSLPTTGLEPGQNYELSLGGDVYRNYVVSDSRRLVAQDGKEFIECDTVEELRSLDARQIWAIQNGYYKGVKLNGYYEKGDTPAPIDYYLSDTEEEDDGGSVFDVSGIKLEHDFNEKVHVSYFGISDKKIKRSNSPIYVGSIITLINNNTVGVNAGDLVSVRYGDGSTQFGYITEIVNNQTFVISFEPQDTIITIFYGGQDSAFKLQKTIDYLLKQGGGSILLGRRFWMSKVFIKPPNQSTPITILGINDRIEQDGWGGAANSTSILKIGEGSAINVNLHETGEGVIKDHLYTGFSINGVLGTNMDGSPNSNLIETFRTRGNYTNLMGAFLKYVIYQPNEDSFGNPSYNDGSYYENIKISFSIFGGLRLYKCDASLIKGVIIESSTDSFEKGVEIRDSTTFNLEGIIHGVGGNEENIPNSAIIYIAGCQGFSIANFHCEDYKVASALDFRNCGGITLKNLFTYSNGNFENGTSINLSYIKGLTIEGWYSYERKRLGAFDIDFGTNSGNSNISYSNVNTFDRSQVAGSTPRALILGNTANAGRPAEGFPVLNVSDFNTVKNNSLMIGATNAPANAPYNDGSTYFNGIHTVTAGNVLYGFDLVWDTYGTLFKRSLFNGVYNQYRYIGGWSALSINSNTNTNSWFIDNRLVEVDTTSGEITITLTENLKNLVGFTAVIINKGTNNIKIEVPSNITLDNSSSVFVNVLPKTTRVISYTSNNTVVTINAFSITRKSGTTAQRPSLTEYEVGQSYFDTTLGKPIYKKSDTEWVDATGTVV